MASLHTNTHMLPLFRIYKKYILMSIIAYEDKLESTTKKTNNTNRRNPYKNQRLEP